MINEFIEGFDLDFFKNLTSFSKRIKYANEKLQKISSGGSSRIVYKIDEKRVLKLARNKKGIAQNMTESDYLLNDWYSDIIAKVLESDENDDTWIVSEYARKISPSRFKQLLGVNIDQFFSYISEHYGKRHNAFYTKQIEPETNEILKDNEFIHQLGDMIGNFDMMIGDFSKVNSFGEIDGRLVIIDYGLSESVFREYYNKNIMGRH